MENRWDDLQGGVSTMDSGIFIFFYESKIEVGHKISKINSHIFSIDNRNIICTYKEDGYIVSKYVFRLHHHFSRLQNRFRVKNPIPF